MSFYLGIDQHANQLTVSLRNEVGDVVLRKQVSTKPNKVVEFFEQMTERCLSHTCGFWAIVEVCGFNDWLVEMLRNFRCEKARTGSWPHEGMDASARPTIQSVVIDAETR